MGSQERREVYERGRAYSHYASVVDLKLATLQLSHQRPVNGDKPIYFLELFEKDAMTESSPVANFVTGNVP